MRDYGKVHTSFWSSDTLRGAGDDAKMLAMYLLTCSHSNMAGCFRLPLAYAVEDLGWVAERLANGFKTLSDIGWLKRCDKSGFTWICKFHLWNKPDNPNQLKAIKKFIDLVPDSVDFKKTMYISWGLGETVVKPLGNSPAPAPAPVPAPRDDEIVDCPHGEIISLYHEVLPMGTRVKTWTDTRQGHLRARWREESKRQTLDYWRLLFDKCKESDFLMGRKHSKDRKPFTISLDWLVMPENFAKVIEGKYDNEARP